MSSPFLFIYGTLLIADNEFAIYLRTNSDFHTKAKFKGKLYDAGEYPVAVESQNDEFWINGSIVKLKDADNVLEHVDQYEGYGKGQPQPYLYVRTLILATTAEGELECWVYIYHQPIDGFHQIKSGDYLEYLAQKKSR